MAYVVGSQVGMKYEGAAVEMTGSYHLSAELFATHHNLNRVGQDLSLETDFGRLLASVLPKGSTIAILPDFQSLVTSSPDATTGGIRTPRTNTLRNAFEISDSTSLSTVTRIELAYKNIYTQYQDPALIDS